MSEYHQPVMLEECIEGLQIKPNGIYVDVTFGGGGHSRAIVEKLKRGKLVAFDQDADALENIPKNKRLIFVQHNFKYLKRFLRYHNIEKIDGLLADLGVSSHHFDTADRGFSFRFKGDLDMRMNQKATSTAADILNVYDEKELFRIFKFYGELKNGFHIAKQVVAGRKEKPIKTIDDFIQVIQKCIPKKNQNQFLAKLFQALRIEVNQEIECLKEMLEQSRDSLSSGGRLVVISYHSLEDRLVKNFMRWGNFEGASQPDIYGNTNPVFKVITKSIVVPGDKELQENNRARSAKLRIAEKI